MPFGMIMQTNLFDELTSIT